jgi:hypothetical protein
MDGCMVTKVPEMLRKEQAWCHAWPDRPQVIEYVSILLNATGLRKGPGIGYTLARQIVRCDWICSRRDLPCSRDMALVLNISSGSVFRCARSRRSAAMPVASIVKPMRLFVVKRGEMRRALFESGC